MAKFVKYLAANELFGLIKVYVKVHGPLGLVLFRKRICTDTRARACALLEVNADVCLWGVHREPWYNIILADFFLSRSLGVDALVGIHTTKT